MEIQKYRAGVGKLLYVSSARPNVQNHVKEFTYERISALPSPADWLHECQGHSHQGTHQQASGRGLKACQALQSMKMAMAFCW